jgi:hypothetical protein
MKYTDVERDQEGNFVLQNSLDIISEEDGSSESKSGSSYYYSEEESDEHENSKITEIRPNTLLEIIEN